MALRSILHFPHPQLRQVGQPIDTITPDIQRLIDDMIDTMYNAHGAGLAATQIGVPVQLFVVDVAEEDQPSDLTVFLNPVLLHKEGKTTSVEGCLSFPGVREEILRATHVTMRAMDRHGKPFELTAEGFLAIALQHEHDHLQGVLLIDHMGPLRKRFLHKTMIKKASYSF